VGARLMAQERYNATWATAIGAALTFRKAAELADAVARIAEPARHAAMRQAISAHPNTAIFDLPAILDNVFGLGRAAKRA